MGSIHLPDGKRAHPPFLLDLGIGYLLLGIQPIFVRSLARHVTSVQTVFLRFAFAAMCIFVLCVVRRRGIITRQPFWSAMRGIAGGIAVYFYFASVAEVGAARAALLNYTYPLWANLFAFLLGARPPRRFFFGLAVAFIGVVLVLSPARGDGLFAVRMGEAKGLLSAVFAGISVLIIKQLRQTDEASSIVAAFTVGGLLISSWGHEPTETLGTLIDPELAWFAWGVGATSFFGHVFFTRGYKGATVQQATLLSLSVPVIAASLGIVVLGEPAGPRFLSGAAIVFAALVYVASEGAAERRKERK